MKERLTEFLACKGISQKKFETNVGVSTGFVNNVGDSIRESNLKKISNKYPELNINWLKTGEGEMLKPVGGIHVVGDNNISNTGITGGDVIIGINQEIKALKKQIKQQQEEIEQLKKDKAILQDFINVLKNNK